MPENSSPEFVKIPYGQMESKFQVILSNIGFSEERARTCASIFAQNSLDGVYTHGVNRFTRFVQYVASGHIDPDKQAVCKGRAGNIEQWDGQMGPGPINALHCTERAMEIAAQQGMGCVALANTNHWMRGGTYGWHAAKKGFVFIGWTNTTANMPTWGAVNSKLGNNPLVLAVPYQDHAIVLDMAMSQYSFGAIDFYNLKGQELPVPGGFTTSGELTSDPGAILRSKRILPIGYWKGAGLSLLLDILATILSGGNSVADISKQTAEAAVSQVFIAIQLSGLSNYKTIAATIQHILEDYHQSVPDGSSPILFPGERVLAVRESNSLNGIPVLKKVWDEIETLG
ncbi:MAG TPA: 3-dehydro-L-gulonate 2-dehydrogenase [Chryseolinea sp.]|nr:3-dehydro-L-gulonate 2-dehydrogenase [Chryseolinea sp.]